MSILHKFVKRYTAYSNYSLFKVLTFNRFKYCEKKECNPHINNKITEQNLGYNNQSSPKSNFRICFILPTGLLAWLGFSTEEEEDEMIVCMKRSILCIQRNELAKAEQMLHLALRLAQQKQNSLGVTYIYDLMANLAFERDQLQKAETLFVTVMQHLLSTGTKEDDLKIIHISLKLCQIFHSRGEIDKAEQGFTWSITHLKNQVAKSEENASEDLLGLYSMAQYWYALLLADMEKFDEADQYLKDAYEIYKVLQEKDAQQEIIFLNNLGAINLQKGNLTLAEQQLRRAVVIAKDHPDMVYVGSIHANLGLVLIQQGLYEEAKKACGFAFRMGKQMNNKEIEEQAGYCLSQLKSTVTAAHLK